jgi:hypothetical protein
LLINIPCMYVRFVNINLRSPPGILPNFMATTVGYGATDPRLLRSQTPKLTGSDMIYENVFIPVPKN